MTVLAHPAREGVRFSTGIQTLVANGTGDGVAIGATGTIMWTPGTNKKLVIVKIRAYNATGGNSLVWIGYGDLTGAGSVFRQTMTSFVVLNGIDAEIPETRIPRRGNAPDGFCADATLVTGSTGAIIAEVDNGAAGAGLQLELELIEF